VAKCIRQPAVKPTFAELQENYLRDVARQTELELQRDSIFHARTAYLLYNVGRKDRTENEKVYFYQHYDSLQSVETRYREDAATARQVADASLRAWMAAAGE
jgi:hypothetical protein